LLQEVNLFVKIGDIRFQAAFLTLQVGLFIIAGCQGALRLRVLCLQRCIVSLRAGKTIRFAFIMDLFLK
jgi:hypothetical protein